MSETTNQTISALAERMEGKGPEEILAVAAERFPGRVQLACSFGPEDCVLVDLIARAKIPIGVFTIDTGFLFLETYALWRRIEEKYGIAIETAATDAVPFVAGTPRPWEVDPDECCRRWKVVPLRSKLATLDAWVTGIRRDQTPDRATSRVFEWDARFELVKVNPLVAWTSEQIWDHVSRFDVPTNPLHALGYLSIGCAPCTTPVKPGEDPRSGRWRGREKTECGLHVRDGALVRPDASR